MKVADFDYELPSERIAQQPLERRTDSRLMVLDRAGGKTSHRRFGELPTLLAAGDLLVLNDTRVIPARLFASKPTGGRVEILLLEREAGEGGAADWRWLLRASHPPKPGAVLEVAEMWDREVGDLLHNKLHLTRDGHVALALGYGSLYNHSYQPNARCEDVRPQTKRFVAIRDIQANEEITFNYGGTVDCQDPVGFKVLD